MIATSPPHPKEGTQVPRCRTVSLLLVLLDISCICRRNHGKDRDTGEKKRERERTKSLQRKKHQVEKVG